IPLTAPSPVWNLAISFIPAKSNQNTAFNAWCNPVGINKRLKKPYKNAPPGPKSNIHVPNVTIAEYTTGQTHNIITAINILKNAVKIGTKRLPLRNDNAVGSSVLLNLLDVYAATRPIIKPIKTF